MLNDSLFVSNVVQERAVKLPDGSEHVLFFKELPAIEFRRFYLASQSADEDIRIHAIAKLIAAAMCDADGKTVIDAERASQLKMTAMNEIFMALLDVNGQGDQKKD